MNVRSVATKERSDSENREDEGEEILEIYHTYLQTKIGFKQDAVSASDEMKSTKFQTPRSHTPVSC